MSKLAHSNDETMEWIDFKAAIAAGNEDLVFYELQDLRKESLKLSDILEAFGPAEDDMINPIVVKLKQEFGGEGWACGEIIKRCQIARKPESIPGLNKP